MASASQEITIKIDPKDWQEIIAYIRALEERVMKLEAQQAQEDAEEGE